MSLTRPPSLLGIIVAAYLILGVQFALYTPAWQAPDEPAHYNYVRYLVENQRFPVLQVGDYSHAYMEEIKRLGFPPALSIDPIRYEFHQPPLYYLVLSPIFVLTAGALLPLRLFSVLLGTGIIVAAYTVARRICPSWPGLALGAAALVAFLPQHLATVAQVGNDVLAELLFALVLLQLVAWPGISAAPVDPDAIEAQHTRRRRLLGLGLVLGLILITKTTAYIAVPLAGLALLFGWRQERAEFRQVLADVLLIALPAIVLAAPWYLRDLSVYGWPDFLGLIRHDAVVLGQPRTAEWLAQNGLPSYLDRLLTFTFRSFWGMFGWLSVPMDGRVYTALALMCAIVAGGLIMRMAYAAPRRPGYVLAMSGKGAAQPQSRLPASQREAPINPDNAELTGAARKPQYGVWLLAGSAFLSLAVYAWYNLQFVQHQGRYLFTALIPFGLAFSLGWKEALHPRRSWLPAAALALLAVILIARGLVTGDGIPGWPVAMAVIAAIGLAIRPYLPRPLGECLFAAPYVLLPLVSLYALHGAILPQLLP